MSLKVAIKNKDLSALKDTVTKAVEVTVEAAKRDAEALVKAVPAEPTVNSVHGNVILSAVFDDDTLWQTIAGEYTSVLQEVAAKTPKDATDKEKEEIAAAIISKSAILRNLAAPSASVKDGLL